MIRSFTPTRLACLLLLSMFGATLPAAPPTAEAAGATWGSPVAVSQSSYATYSPRTAYDGEGFLHAVYFSGKSQSEWDIFYTNNRGGSWATPRQISDNDKAEQRNADIAISRDGHVHVLYQKTTGSAQVFYVESPDLGSSWGKPLNVSNTTSRAYEPSLTADADGGVHAVWIDGRWSDSLSVTYSSKPAGGTFGAPRKIGGNQFEKDPDVVTTGSGGNLQVHVVYQGRKTSSNSTSDFDVWYGRGVGGQFAAPTNFSRDSKWSLSPAITSDGGSGVFITWDTGENYHDVVFSASNNGGTSWSARRSVYSRSTPGLTPALAYGLRDGVQQVHLAWSEGDSGKRSVLYLTYNQATNSWAPTIEKASPSGVLDSTVAASAVTSESAVAFRDKTLRSAVASRGAGPFAIVFEDYQEPNADSRLDVVLANVPADASEYRLSIDRLPNDLDPWQPLTPRISVEAQQSEQCRRVFYLQFRLADGRLSTVYSKPFQVDAAVQALIDVAAVGGYDPLHTRDDKVAVRVRDSGECAGLRRMLLNGQSPIDLDADGFEGEVGLGAEEGVHPFVVQVEDVLGNQLTVSRTLVVDRTAPEVLSGTLAITAPVAGLPTILATLRFSDVAVRDEGYGGAWGLLLANAPADDKLADTALEWRPVRVEQAEGAFDVPAWSVLRGLSSSVDDRSLAGKLIEVRAKLVDGAGNPSSTTLTTTVRLATDYRAAETFLPTTLR